MQDYLIPETVEQALSYLQSNKGRARLLRAAPTCSWTLQRQKRLLCC